MLEKLYVLPTVTFLTTTLSFSLFVSYISPDPGHLHINLYPLLHTVPPYYYNQILRPLYELNVNEDDGLRHSFFYEFPFECLLSKSFCLKNKN